MLILTFLLIACSSDDQEDTGDTTSIQYEIPSEVCTDAFSAAIPVDFFPPGKELSTIDTDLPGAKFCSLSVDYENFFTAKERIAGHDIDFLVEGLSEIEPQGEAIRIPDAYEIHIWDNLAIARTPCTPPPDSFAHEYEGSGQIHYTLTVGVVPPADLENTRQLLEEYIVEAFDESFRTTPHCEESDAAAE